MYTEIQNEATYAYMSIFVLMFTPVRLSNISFIRSFLEFKVSLDVSVLGCTTTGRRILPFATPLNTLWPHLLDQGRPLGHLAPFKLFNNFLSEIGLILFSSIHVFMIFQVYYFN